MQKFGVMAWAVNRFDEQKAKGVSRFLSTNT